MPACPACGVAMTPDEWSSGSCFACRAPLLEQKRYYETAAAFDPNSPASVKIKDNHRPAWGTVRTGLLLHIVGVVFVWLTAFGGTSLEVLVYKSEKLSPAKMLFATIAVFSLLGSLFSFLAGFVLCAAVPPVARMRRWMLMSAGFLCVGTVLVLAVRYMAVSNEREEHLREKRETYLQKLELIPIGESMEWDDTRWSETAIQGFQIVYWTVLFATAATYVLFLWSLAGVFKRRLLQRIILGLCAGLLVAVSSLVALSQFETLSPTDVSRGLQEATAQQAGNALLFIAMIVLTVYAGCCWKLRDDIATLLRGESLR